MFSKTAKRVLILVTECMLLVTATVLSAKQITEKPKLYNEMFNLR